MELGAVLVTRGADFTPALGRPELSGLYDAAIALLTRERRWREALLRQVGPRSEDVILDVGCGTGTFALMLKRHAPAATIEGLDPDPLILQRARGKATRAGVDLSWKAGFARDAARDGEQRLTKAVSSLVFHQTPMEEKRAGLHAIFQALRPAGELHIADYGLQRGPVMRTLFRQVQVVDGFENTEPNARGVLAELMREAGFAEVVETQVVPTATGSISLYRARRPLL